MNLSEILKQPSGFTPPEVTVKIEKVYDYKSGESAQGPWSFQTLQVTGGRLKLKGLSEFPKAREGQTVTLKANSSKQHGLTGLKVDHEEYQGKTYDQLLITPSAKWEWAGASTSVASPSTNGHTELDPAAYLNHLLSCASIANQVTTVLGIQDEQAMQASFATICIDAKNRGILLPKDLPSVIPSTKPDAPEEPEYHNEPPPDFDDSDVPF